MTVAKKQAGAASLVEVLITTLVISVGLLGASSMQLLSLKGSASSHYRVQTTLLVNSLVERMRFNPNGVKDGKYGVSDSNPVTCDNFPSSYKNCSTHSCNSDQLALFDLYQISCGLSTVAGIKKEGIQNQLPEGILPIGCGSQACSENIEHTITISWLSSVTANENGQKNESVSLSFIP